MESASQQAIQTLRKLNRHNHVITFHLRPKGNKTQDVSETYNKLNTILTIPDLKWEGPSVDFQGFIIKDKYKFEDYFKHLKQAVNPEVNLKYYFLWGQLDEQDFKDHLSIRVKASVMLKVYKDFIKILSHHDTLSSQLHSIKINKQMQEKQTFIKDINKVINDGDLIQKLKSHKKYGFGEDEDEEENEEMQPDKEVGEVKVKSIPFLLTDREGLVKEVESLTLQKLMESNLAPKFKGCSYYNDTLQIYFTSIFDHTQRLIVLIDNMDYLTTVTIQKKSENQEKNKSNNKKQNHKQTKEDDKKKKGPKQ